MPIEKPSASAPHRARAPTPARGRRRALLTVAAVVVTAGCRAGDARAKRPAAAGAPAVPAPDSLAPRVVVDTLARGLEVPWGIAALPDGRLLVTERPGRIRVIEDGVLRDEPWATLHVHGTDPRYLPESGLMGIVPAPDFDSTGHVYVLATVLREGADTSRAPLARVRRQLRRMVDPASVIAYENHLVRLTDRGGRGSDPTVVSRGLAANFYHAGGALAFGPDGALYAGLGDALHPRLAADAEGTFSSVVRWSPAALAAATPPVPARPEVFARGLRNVQGLAWHPASGALLSTDHGPSRLAHENGRGGHDELNLLVMGASYGWGALAGRDERVPVAVWPVAIAPAAATFAPAAWGPDVLLVTGLRSGALHAVRLGHDDSAWRVAGESRLLEGHGRLRALHVLPSGDVLVGTSTRDGRGTPHPEGDLVLRVRVVPRAAPDGDET